MTSAGKAVFRQGGRLVAPSSVEDVLELGLGLGFRVYLVAEWIYFWDNITHYKRKSVHFLGLMNSATKFRV